MVRINLYSIPNQLLSFEDDNNFYNLRFYQGKENTTLCDVTINDTSIIRGVVVLPNQPIIPYLYLCKDGNFFISVNADDEDISYKNFGINQFLYFGYFE